VRLTELSWQKQESADPNIRWEHFNSMLENKRLDTKPERKYEKPALQVTC